MTPLTDHHTLRKQQHPKVSGSSLLRPWGHGLLFWIVCLAVSGSLLGFIGSIVHEKLCRSDFFKITTITIKGCQNTTKNEILAISGIDYQTNLLALQPELVTTAVKNHPWVIQATIQKRWPNHLNISIQERIPEALLNAKDGLYYLDKMGTAFAKVTEENDLDFPVITTDKQSHEEAANQEAILSALLFLHYAGMGNSFLPKQNISEINLDTDRMVIYLMEKPFAIYMKQDNIKKQYYRLVKVLRSLYKSGEFIETRFIDMNYSDDKVLVNKTETG